MVTVVKSKIEDGKLTDKEASALLRKEFDNYERENMEVIISLAPFVATPAGIGIMQLDEINLVVGKLKELLDVNLIRDDADACFRLADEIQSWMSRGYLAQASAQYIKEAASNIAIVTMPDHVKAMSPTMQKQYTLTKAAEYNAIYTLVERLNAGLSKKIDLIRTFISYEKQVMGLAAYTPNRDQQ